MKHHMPFTWCFWINVLMLILEKLWVFVSNREECNWINNPTEKMHIKWIESKKTCFNCIIFGNTLIEEVKVYGKLIKMCFFRYDTYFYKVFKVYTQLWKFQQENREKLVEAGLKRYEIGEIASRIAQLYFGQYMRTSDMSYLSESYIFYEAILTREYFRDGLHQHLNLANKQLRFLARFLMVCLVLNRREMVHQLVNQLKMWLDECKRVFQVLPPHPPFSGYHLWIMNIFFFFFFILVYV